MATIITDCVLLIFNCKKYKYKALKQKETWLNNFTFMPYFHVIGDPDCDADYKFDHNDHILFVKVQDDYNSLPKKVISAYIAINNEYTFKYIFKTDDDQHLNNAQFIIGLKGLLLKKTPKSHYGGFIINVDKPHLSKYHTIHPELPTYLPILQTTYCSGRFYFLSDFAVQYLITNKILIEKEYLEDYAIGYNLHPTLKLNILNIETHKYFTDITHF